MRLWINNKPQCNAPLSLAHLNHLGVLAKTGSRATFQMQRARILWGDADESEFRQVYLDPCVLMHTMLKEHELGLISMIHWAF